MKKSWRSLCGTTAKNLKMIGHASGQLEDQISRSHQTLPLGGFEIPNRLEIFELERKREGRYKSLCIKYVSNPGDQVYRRRLENPTLGGGKNGATNLDTKWVYPTAKLGRRQTKIECKEGQQSTGTQKSIFT